MYLFLTAVGLWAMGVALRLFVYSFFHGQALPWATLFVNLGGSLVIGFCYGAQSWLAVQLSPAVYTGLTAGLLGALTTFSTFSLDTVRLLEDGAIGWAAMYVLANNCLCIGLCYTGFKLGISVS